MCIGFSFFIASLVQAKFMFNRFFAYRFHENIDYLKKYVIPNFNHFELLGEFSYQSDQGNTVKKLIENAWYGPEKNMYRETLI